MSRNKPQKKIDMTKELFDLLKSTKLERQSTDTEIIESALLFFLNSPGELQEYLIDQYRNWKLEISKTQAKKQLNEASLQSLLSDALKKISGNQQKE